jgi:hypothetical protein
MRENYVSSSVRVMRMGLEDGWSDQSMIEVWVDTYLDLVSVDFDSTLDGLFHMFCVEVAETEMFHSTVVLQVFHRINILGVIVLFHITLMLVINHAYAFLGNVGTHELPVELQ